MRLAARIKTRKTLTTFVSSFYSSMNAQKADSPQTVSRSRSTALHITGWNKRLLLAGPALAHDDLLRNLEEITTLGAIQRNRLASRILSGTAVSFELRPNISAQAFADWLTQAGAIVTNSEGGLINRITAPASVDRR
jgi:hypothetical protein